METGRKYYVIEIASYNDGKKDSYGIYAYTSKTTQENYEDACVAFYGKMRTNMADKTCATCQCFVLDEWNKHSKEDRFDRTVSEIVES